MPKFNEYIDGTVYNIIVQSDIFPKSDEFPEWLTFYVGNYRIATDIYFLEKYGNLILDESLVKETKPDTSKAIQRRINAFLMLNTEKFDRLWKNYKVEYNPIDNYDRYEDSEETFGKTIVAETIGGASNTEVLDNVVNITKNEVAPFDRTAYTDTNATTVTTEGHGENGKIVNTSSSTERTNTTETKGANIDGTRSDKHTAHLHGNIGVTTTVQMLSGDNDFWRYNDFYDFLFKSCIEECCIGLWG